MTAKKEPPVEPPIAEPEPVVEQVVEAVPEPVSPDYLTNSWAGHPHFECKHCPYDTLDEEEMWWHIHDRHIGA